MKKRHRETHRTIEPTHKLREWLYVIGGECITARGYYTLTDREREVISESAIRAKGETRYGAGELT